MIKKPCCSRFLLHNFVQLKYFWTQQFKNVQLEAVYLEVLLYLYCEVILETEIQVIYLYDFCFVQKRMQMKSKVIQ